MATIGDEIPFRRSRIDSRTGSLVLDRHLDETLRKDEPEAPARARRERKGR
ncbi:hypothetical protein [Novosphingobium album (ex Liu et al. 2023)]|uniref:Uncharacterized protein n=1 Tax=Novosphingobium album (ex Liu et al. 2023) TaxID=3031130 RepID=A0ABT5WLY0_9SPHN|nr:hypothetical protein [Novosphingobium album (ex Liu et al. 2023)]MDE8650307.1 hypothetical protein [Novosphingobium album (ex Liu et al. 2023)]